MNEVAVRFLGTGDAFGSGGRLQTCIQLEAPGHTVLIDCGATALVALRRYGLDPAAIDAVVLSHLHGDHFAGVPWLLLDACYVTRRDRPLIVAGPTGLATHIRETLARLYPGAAATLDERVPVHFVELEAGRASDVTGVQVTPWPVRHPSGAPSFGLRLSVAGKTVAFTGDTEWVDGLIDLARGADLLISECSSFDTPVPYHLSYRVIERHRAELQVARLVLTHFGREALSRLDEIELPCAEDGQRMMV